MTRHPRRTPLALATAALVLAVVSVLMKSVDAQTACFVRNCATCNSRNPYICRACRSGYLLTPTFSCNSCAPNFEQNLDERTFVCTACPAGTTSPGGSGQASQCTPVTASRGRRLFDADEDLWA